MLQEKKECLGGNERSFSAAVLGLILSTVNDVFSGDLYSGNDWFCELKSHKGFPALIDIASVKPLNLTGKFQFKVPLDT